MRQIIENMTVYIYNVHIYSKYFLFIFFIFDNFVSNLLFITNKIISIESSP